MSVIALAVAMVVAPAGAEPERASRPRPVQAGPAVVWPLDIRSASVTQVGTDLRLTVATRGGFSATLLAADAGRSLCVDLLRANGGAAVRRLCLALRSGKAVMVRESLSAAGTVSARRTVAATIRRPDPKTMVADVATADAGLGVGGFRWQAVTTWVDSAGCSGTGCSDAFPATAASAKVHSPIPSGCVATGASYRLNGSRRHRVVALSFDDGPSPYTPQMLALLRRHRAHATFFEVGNQMGGRAAIQKRILADGNTIGDHSWSHPVLSGAGPFAESEVGRTKSRIVRQTGFTPCLFRAPYGAVSPGLIGIARGRGMLTIEWDVDPTDWARPGAGAIASRVLAQARPGSIILMHDGGGNRSQSVAAADTILGVLKRRGYRIVSVETLLGLKATYR